MRAVSITGILPSPENDEIYGAIDPTDSELIDLAGDIARNGIREPRRVSTDHYIVSGHRRFCRSPSCQAARRAVEVLPV